jgi:3,4-dihydroxy-2-butanone 4-phosphate synthase
MLESDGDGALSLEGAREYAARHGIPMITGEQISATFDEKD